MLVAKEPKDERKLISEGVHIAICIGVFDLGVQYNKIFDKEVHQVLFQWEIPSERITVEGKDLPMAISKRYTLSLHEKAQLRKDLEAWRSKAFSPEDLEGFDLKNMLKKNCQLQIIHVSSEGKTYANIAGLMALPKGVKSVEPENPLKFFSIEDGKAFPKDMPNWIKSLIEESKEYKQEATSEEEPPITEEEEPTDEESQETLQDLRKTLDEERITPMHPISEGLPKKRVKKEKEKPFEWK